MGSKNKTVALLLVLLTIVLIVPLNPVNSQTQQNPITINPDGSVSGTDKIRQDANTYTLTANLTIPITINKDNIVLDGAGFTLQGSNKMLENNNGVSLTGKSKIIIENLSIIGFDNAIILNNSRNCVIQGNKIDGNNNQGININNSQEIWVNQNSLEATSLFALYAYNTNYTLFTENTISNNFGGGLYITANIKSKDYNLSPLNSVISNNLFAYNSRNSAGYDDISIHGSNVTVIGNEISIDNPISSSSGLYFDGNNISVAKNNFTNCWNAIAYFGENNTFTQNNFVKNNRVAFTNGVDLSNVFFLNNFIDNDLMVIQLYMFTDPSSPRWNNGTFGNYYSDYQSKYSLAKEIDNTGTYDTNYTILDHRTLRDAYPFYDNHPLVNPVKITQPPAATPTWQIPTQTPINSYINIAVVIVFVILAVAIIFLLFYRRYRKNSNLSQ
jgi:hypothetical protein